MNTSETDFGVLEGMSHDLREVTSGDYASDVWAELPSGAIMVEHYWPSLEVTWTVTTPQGRQRSFKSHKAAWAYFGELAIDQFD